MGEGSLRKRLSSERRNLVDVHVTAFDATKGFLQQTFKYTVPDVDEIHITVPIRSLIYDGADDAHLSIDLGDVTVYLSQLDCALGEGRVLAVGWCWHHEWD